MMQIHHPAIRRLDVPVTRINPDTQRPVRCCQIELPRRRSAARAAAA
jgi:hypothetical protein